MSSNAVINRAPRTPGTFGTYHKSILEDKRLSPEAKILLIRLLNNSESWEIILSFLKKDVGLRQFVGKKAVNQLKKCGYIHSYRKGIQWYYVINEIPIPDRSIPDRSDSDQSETEQVNNNNPDNNKSDKNNTYSNKKISNNNSSSNNSGIKGKSSEPQQQLKSDIEIPSKQFKYPYSLELVTVEFWKNGIADSNEINDCLEKNLYEYQCKIPVKQAVKKWIDQIKEKKPERFNAYTADFEIQFKNVSEDLIGRSLYNQNPEILTQNFLYPVISEYFNKLEDEYKTFGQHSKIQAAYSRVQSIAESNGFNWGLIFGETTKTPLPLYHKYLLFKIMKEKFDTTTNNQG